MPRATHILGRDRSYEKVIESKEKGSGAIILLLFVVSFMQRHWAGTEPDKTSIMGRIPVFARKNATDA